jgi:XTP/dITP diphosphohydrolase
MPLLVVLLARAETELLTLAEWEALCACERVLFEDPSHPLAGKLTEAGVEVSPFDDDPDAARDGWALVAEPTSPRVLDLARAGARISVGPGHPPDGLSAAYGAPIARRAAASVADLATIMARLRGPEGCPWDREQSHASLEVHLIEEAHEVLEAIDEGHLGDELEEELGDLLLQVAFHAQMAADDHRFDLADVAQAIVAKLVRRHPHVFGDVSVSGAGEVVRNWEAIKATEKARAGAFDDIPAGLPALLSAYKTQKRAAALGFEATDQDALERARQELALPVDGDSLGEALFWAVAAARAAGIDPEGALRRATLRFRASFPSATSN